MMRQFLILFFAASFLHAQQIDPQFLKDYDAATVIYNRSSKETTNFDAKRSTQRMSPCSTFKIYNTLIGLELGFIHDPDASWYKWDGIHREYEEWNHDLTLREAFRVSCVPAYQNLARQIDVKRMEKYIRQIDYGTKDISAGIDLFWLSSPKDNSIKISADEQVALLNKLLDGKLPFSKKNIGILKDIMLRQKTEKGALYGKTGSGKSADGKKRIGWFVGFLESKGATYVFACNIIDEKNASGKAAQSIVERIFKSQGLL